MRELAEHLEKKFGSRLQGVTLTTPGADSANAQNMQDRTGSSSSVEPSKSDEPGSFMSVPLPCQNVPGK